MIARSSLSRLASPMMCVEKITVFPSSRACRIIAMILREVITSSPTVGSSNTTTSGSWTIVRAIDTFCVIPVESLPIRLSRNSPMSSAS